MESCACTVLHLPVFDMVFLEETLNVLLLCLTLSRFIFFLHINHQYYSNSIFNSHIIIWLKTKSFNVKMFLDTGNEKRKIYKTTWKTFMEPKDNLFSERNMQREKRAVHSIKLLNVMMWQVIGQHRIFTWKKSDGEVFHVSPRVLLKLQGNPWDRTSPYYFDTNDTLLCRWHWFKLNPYTIHHQLNICIISNKYLNIF